MTTDLLTEPVRWLSMLVLAATSLSCGLLASGAADRWLRLTPEARRGFLAWLFAGYVLWTLNYAANAWCQSVPGDPTLGGLCWTAGDGANRDFNTTHGAFAVVVNAAQATCFLAAAGALVRLRGRSSTALDGARPPHPAAAAARRLAARLLAPAALAAAVIVVGCAWAYLRLPASTYATWGTPVSLWVENVPLLGMLVLGPALYWEYGRVEPDPASVGIAASYSLYPVVALLPALAVFAQEPEAVARAERELSTLARLGLATFKLGLLFSAWNLYALVRQQRRSDELAHREMEAAQEARAALAGYRARVTRARHTVGNRLAALLGMAPDGPGELVRLDEVQERALGVHDAMRPLLEPAEQVPDGSGEGCALGPALAAAVAEVGRDFPDLRVELHPAPGGPFAPPDAAVVVPPWLVHRLLGCAAENAVRHGHAATLRVTVEPHDGWTAVHLDNDGAPPPPERVPTLFVGLGQRHGLAAVRYDLSVYGCDLAYVPGPPGVRFTATLLHRSPA